MGFLKYPGSKKHIPLLKRYLTGGKTLCDPFVGSGAIFMGTSYERYILSDINAPLISLYRYIQGDVDGFINGCLPLFNIKNNTESRYYALREEFNHSTDDKIRSHIYTYLNAHDFNGLHRFSKKSGFNVPFGTMKNPRLNIESIKAFADKSNNCDVIFTSNSYEHTLIDIPQHSHIAIDPPYTKLPDQKTAFTQYYGNKFGFEEHEILASRLFELRKLGHHVVITDHDTPEVRTRYQGSHFETFAVRRSISASNTKRGKVAEVLISLR